jgi:predicted PurR-regulated permease PerM
VSGSDQAFVARAARLAIVGGLTAAWVLALVWVLEAALTPLAAAFVIAYLFDPLVDRFEARRVRRGVAVVLLVLVLGGGLAVFLLYLVPRVQRELVSLASALPGYLDRFTTVVLPGLEQRLGIELPHTFVQLVDQLRAQGIAIPFETIGGMLAAALLAVTGTVTGLLGLLVIPILAYYLLVEFDSLLARLAGWIPQRQRAYVVEKVQRVDRLISGFLRGQLLVAAILGVLYAVGLTVIGIDLAIGIGLVAGVLGLVPYLGSVTALVGATLLCLLEFGVDGHLLAVVVWHVLVQSLEGFVLTPRIVGRSVGLHPAVVIVALLIAGDLFGFLGLLLAVPGAAVLKVFVDEILELYRRSSLFADPGDGEAGA